MEHIYKIKIRTEIDPQSLYPSERRYSASIVLGLGVVHLALASTGILLGCLTFNYGETSFPEDISNSHTINLPIMVTFAPCIMSLGALGAGSTGLLAWKRWYIDHSITWFFCMSFASIITSCISLTFIAMVLALTSVSKSVKSIITLNILIAAILEWLWSCVSTKVSYVGMRNVYPDDTITQETHSFGVGNNKNSINLPDLISNFLPQVSGNFAKYLFNTNKEIDNRNLPKDESLSEFKDRVNKFLASVNSSH